MTIRVEAEYVLGPQVLQYALEHAGAELERQMTGGRFSVKGNIDMISLVMAVSEAIDYRREAVVTTCRT